MLKSLSSESVGEIMNTLNSSVIDDVKVTAPIKPTVRYAEKKPNSAFSYVMPPKKRFRESLETMLNPESRNDGSVVINIPIDVKKQPDGSITRVLHMTKNRATVGFANEIDVFYTNNPNSAAVANLEKNFAPICKHIKECKNAGCPNCIMSKILKNPNICHQLMNHTLRCNTHQCNIRVCKIFKNYMQFKFMVYNPPAPAASQPESTIINGRVIHNPAAKENENMIKKQKTDAAASAN